MADREDDLDPEEGGEQVVKQGPVAVLSQVEKTYQLDAIKVPVIKGVNILVRHACFTVLLGPSGSGKTTLLNMIGCIDRPEQGTVTVAGCDVGSLDDDALSDFRAETIGFIFQNFNLIPVLTAYENAEQVLSLQGVPERERKARVLQLLEEVGLKGLENRRPHELSGGQQQRVAIARAIASRPAIVLADEPTANVDSETAEKLLALMARLNKDSGVTFLFSTHDPRVMKYARRLIGLVDGKVDSDVRKEEGA